MSEMTVQAPDLPACGDRLTGGWQVERVLSTVGSVPGLLVVDEVGDRAVAFVLPAEAPDPPLDEERAGRWGTLRRVFRDDTWGRLVIDGVPEGDLLEDWLAQGRELPRAWIDRLSEDVRADHRADAWHGQIAPDRIVVGEQGLVVAGWGLGESHGEAQRSRDLAALAALSSHQGACEPPSPRSDGAGSGPNISPRLQAALAADHIPTLRAALTELEASDDGGPGELARARDALQRLESRAASQLEAAERMIEQGDPLGAVAACREAIRIGEEARAQPILNRARREARRLLSGQQRDVWRRYVIYAAGAVAVLVALVSLGAWLMPSGDPSPFETRLAQLQDEGGRRAVVRWLAEQEARGEGSFESRERLSRELQRLADEERARLLELRRQTVARGARPHRADRIAETGLDTLAGLAAVDAGSPPTPAAIDQVLRDVDRAATRYRAATSIDGATAGEAIDRVLALDPLFAGAGRSR